MSQRHIAFMVAFYIWLAFTCAGCVLAIILLAVSLL
jgi:type III secretory pathway component EscR